MNEKVALRFYNSHSGFYTSAVPKKLKRYNFAGHLHFVTFSCYRRQALLSAPRRRDALLKILEATRRKYKFPVLGYVLMPEHVHFLIGAPAAVDPSTAIQSLKQRSNARFKAPRRPTLFPSPAADHFWQKRFYDFNVYTRKKVIEKLRYMHRNPVARGLVLAPDQWRVVERALLYVRRRGAGHDHPAAHAP